MDTVNRPDPEARGGDRTSVLHGVVVFVVPLLVFAHVSTYDFVNYDDDRNVYECPLLNPVTAGNLARLWREPFQGMYVPMSYSAWSLLAVAGGRDESSGRLRPQPFHITNLVVHLSNGVLVYLILLALTRLPRAACFGALTFSLHPVQVESVAWVSELRGLLSCLFVLTAVLCCVRAVGMRTDSGPNLPDLPRRWSCESVALRVGCVAACVMGLLSKPSAVVFPAVAGIVLVLLADRKLFRACRDLIPAAIPCFAFALLTMRWQQPGDVLSFTVPVWQRPVIAGDSLAFYMTKLVIPWPLALDYGRTPQSVLQTPWSYVGALLSVAVLAFSVVYWHRKRWLAAPLLVFVAWTLPVLGLIPFHYQNVSTVTDRYLYGAMFAPALMMAGWIATARSSRRPQIIATALLVVWAAGSWVQSGHWRDSRSLFSHAVSVNPASHLCWNGLGLAYQQKGQVQESLACFATAITVRPEFPQAHTNLGKALALLGRTALAVEQLRAAVRLQPRSARALNSLGVALAELGQRREALTLFRQAIESDPYFVEAHFNLGGLALANGHPEQALVHYREALARDEHNASLHINVGQAFAQLGETREAMKHYALAAALAPENALPYYNLANLYVRSGQLQEAAAHYRDALLRQPQYVEALSNLASVLGRLGRYAEAHEHYARTREIAPALGAMSHCRQGLLCEEQGKTAEAAAHYRRALELDPQANEAKERLSALGNGAPAGGGQQ